jgi:hypothetical protein
MYTPKLRSEVFLREDVEAILCAIRFTQRRSSQHMSPPDAVQYRAGFESALEAVSLALHIPLDSQEAESLDPALVRVLRPAGEDRTVSANAPDASERLLASSPAPYGRGSW